MSEPAFQLEAAERSLVAEVSDFADQSVAPAAAAWERDREFPLSTLQDAAREGYLGLLVPRALGGLELRPTAMAACMDTLAARDFFFAFALVVHNNLAGAIARDGSDEHRSRYLPELLSGRRIGAFLLTEPGGGSDAAAITSRASPDGAGWRLSGEKAWISNAVGAGLLSIYAQTDPALGSRGIAAFLVEAETPGVVRLPGYEILGGHALGTGGFRFDDCTVPETALFLAPGRAFKAAMAGIDLARVNVAAMCCGMLDTAIAGAVRYSRERRAFGRPLTDHQGLLWMLADAATDLAAARALTCEAARQLDAGESATLAAAHAKKFATRAAMTHIAHCMQVYGARGMAADLPLGRHLAAAKMSQYLDGTTEIQNLVIGRALLAAADRPGSRDAMP
ncbi:MAG: acyl-CoA dehydrogenase family protein [Gammaproteobacteria bacterium]|nr:acyl-CoA dehydrogenase family protein [Gammaproteobacteria bacterium]